MKNDSLIPIHETPLAAPSTRTEAMMAMEWGQLLATIKAGQAMQAELARIAVASTHDIHWDRFGDTMRLNVQGAQHIARLAQITIKNVSNRLVERETDDKGQVIYLRYEAVVRLSSPWGPTHEETGVCDSDHQFHSTRYDKTSREKYRLRATEINRANLPQHARSAAIARGVARYLGLEKLTLEEIRAASRATSGGGQASYDSAKSDEPKAKGSRKASPIQALESFKKAIWGQWAKLCESEGVDPAEEWERFESAHAPRPVAECDIGEVTALIGAFRDLLK